MTDFKHLVSPFTLVPFTETAAAKKKATPRPAPPCNCESDEENDFGMAPECAFVCNHQAFNHTKSKKRGIKRPTRTKTKRIKH
jgi:hypothetical protein